MVKLEGRGSKVFKFNGNAKQVDNGQRHSGIEEDCIGSQVHNGL